MLISDLFPSGMLSGNKVKVQAFLNTSSSIDEKKARNSNYEIAGSEHEEKSW